MVHARVLKPDRPIDLALTLAPLRRGGGDPTMILSSGEVWRATRTPRGPATVRLAPSVGGVRVDAWGPGAEWALDRAPDLAGLHDDPSSFRPCHDLVADMHRRLPGLRLGRTNGVVEALVPSIIEQRVAGAEAWISYARLVRRYGEPAPGPAPLFVPPPAERLAAMPYYLFHPLGIERRRAETIRRACALATRLEGCVDLPPAEAHRRLVGVPGVGEWTAAEVSRVALGDPDAVSVGDFHLPHVVAWALAGEPRGDDARMLELLAPYAGQRARAVRLIEESGAGPPRRAPRKALRRIERL